MCSAYASTRRGHHALFGETCIFQLAAEKKKKPSVSLESVKKSLFGSGKQLFSGMLGLFFLSKAPERLLFLYI